MIATPDQVPLWMNPCYPRDALDISKQYTIVGIYTGLFAYKFVFPFTPDMIYVPKGSVPQAAEFEEEFSIYAFAVSLLLENGKLDAFDTYVTEEGCEGWFLYFDQGYTEVAEALNETMASALRLLVASAVAFLAALCIYFFLLINAFSPVIWRMRIIGARAGTCWRQALGAAVPLLLLSVAVGAALGGAFFGAVSRAVLTQAAEYPLSVALLCALGQFGLLCVLAAVILLTAARRPLMRKRKPRR